MELPSTLASRIQRHFDAERLNEIANDPDVRPTCGGDGKSYLNFDAFVSDPKNHALVWDQGALLFYWTAPETYELHVMVLPEGRGKDAYRMVQEGIDCLIASGALHLWARVAHNFNALRHLAAHTGFIKCGTDTLDIGFGPVA